MHLMADALERIRTHSYAFLCIRVQVRHEDPLQLGVLGGLLVGAAHLLGTCYIGTWSQPVRSPSGPCCMLPCAV